MPVVNKHGKVHSKRVYQWSNHARTSPLTMRVTVSADKRPQRQSFEARNKDTLVLRLTMDIRYCGKQAWNTATKQAGLTARKWLNHFLQNQATMIHDTWGWELVSTGKEQVIRGLVRLKVGSLAVSWQQVVEVVKESGPSSNHLTGPRLSWAKSPTWPGWSGCHKKATRSMPPERPSSPRSTDSHEGGDS